MGYCLPKSLLLVFISKEIYKDRVFFFLKLSKNMFHHQLIRSGLGMSFPNRKES